MPGSGTEKTGAKKYLAIRLIYCINGSWSPENTVNYFRFAALLMQITG
jgi:hypothetical protein